MTSILDPSNGGPWSAQNHLETIEQKWIEENILDFILDLAQPKTMCDFGCGPGLYVKFARGKGVDAVGVEPLDMTSIFQAPGHQLRFDLTEYISLPNSYDLVICLEVAEHIPRKFEATLLDNISRHTKDVLLFSAARPKQPGLGHVNLRPWGYWVDKLAKAGLHHQPIETQICRRISRLPWFQTNVTVFSRSTERFSALHYDHIKLTHLLEGTGALFEKYSRINYENMELFAENQELRLRDGSARTRSFNDMSFKVKKRFHHLMHVFRRYFRDSS